jgi:HEAT repeat protein
MGHPGQKKALVALRETAIGSLSDMEPAVQQEALVLLGAVGRQRELPHIEPFLRSENPRLRVEAAGALLQIEARTITAP